MSADLAFLRELFSDSRLHNGIGTITKLGLSQDGSKLRVQVNLLPENREVVAMMTFEDVYSMTFPEINDLVLVAFIDGHPDEAHVTKFVNTKEEPIPVFARTGNTVRYSRPGKKNYLGSDTKVGIGRPDVEPAAPLVLGDTLTEYLTKITTYLTTLANVCNSMATAVNGLAPGTVVPPDLTDLAQLASTISSDKSTYLTTDATNIKSQIAFTERGV